MSLSGLSKKSIESLTVLMWSAFCFFACTGFVCVFNAEIKTGGNLLLLALIFFPPLSKQIEKKLIDFLKLDVASCQGRSGYGYLFSLALFAFYLVVLTSFASTRTVKPTHASPQQTPSVEEQNMKFLCSQEGVGKNPSDPYFSECNSKGY